MHCVTSPLHCLCFCVNLQVLCKTGGRDQHQIDSLNSLSGYAWSITATEMNDNTTLLLQLQEDLLQVIGNISKVVNFFLDHPCGHTDDIIHYFGIQVKKDLLHEACRNGHISVVRYIIGERSGSQDKYKYFASIKGQCIDLQPNNSKVYFKSSSSTQSTSIIYPQLHANGWTKVEYYFTDDRACDPEVKDSHQNTPLHLACHGGHINIVRYLMIEVLCDYDVKNDNRSTPVHLACEKGHLNIVRYLIEECKCDPEIRDQLMYTPLHIACIVGHTDIVRYLVQRGCNLEARNDDQSTPVHFACSNNHLNIVRYLIDECGCDQEITGESLGTPLHFACLFGSIGIVRYLVQRGCNCEARTQQLFTPLHCACQKGHIDIVQYLISKVLCDYNVRSASQSTPVHSACIGGHLNIVHYLVDECGCDPEITDQFLCSPLHFACLSGHIDIVRYLIQRGCNYEARDASQSTPVHLACKKGHLSIVRYLVEECKCDPDIRGQLMYTPLHITCIVGHTDIVRYLVQRGCNLEARNDDQSTPVHFACSNNHLNIVRYLIDECGCDQEITGESLGTPLHFACLFGSIGIVRYLVQRGCNCEARTQQLFTPLHCACQKGHIDIVQYLISKVLCDYNVRSASQSTPVHSACIGGHLNIVHYLVDECGCDPEITDQFLCSPLHFACLSGHIDIVRYLIQRGCNYEARDASQSTPVHLACEKGHLNIVRYLIDECGCNPEITDQFLSTPLHLACLFGQKDIVCYLVKRECNLEATNSHHSTPVHLACKKGYLDIVHYLIDECGCDQEITGESLCTPLHFACFFGHIDIVRYLVQHGCNIEAKAYDQLTPLHIACKNGHIHIMKYLSEQGCDPFMKNENHVSPFQCAIVNGCFELIKYFVNVYGTGIMNGNTCCGSIASTVCPTLLKKSTIYRPIEIAPLHAACFNGHLDVVKYLVEEVGVDQSKVCKLEQMSTSPLLCACNGGHLDIVQYLLAGMDTYGRRLEREIRDACFGGHTDIVNYFINDRNVDPNTEDIYGNNLLQFAISGSNMKSNQENALKVLQALTFTSINLNKTNCFGDAALHTACKMEQLSLVECLLKANCDPNVKNVFGYTPLGTICGPDIIEVFMPYIPTSVCERILSNDIEESKSLELLKLLVTKFNWDPSEIMNNGNTALHLACEINRLKIVEYLLLIHCNPNVQNKEGDTPLVMTSNLDIIRILNKHSGVCSIDFVLNLLLTEAQILQLLKELDENDNDLNSVNCDGDTVLHLACKTNRPTAVKFLLDECEVDWDINAKNYSGASPIQLSTDSDVIRELICHGAKPTDLYSYCRRVLRTSKLLETTVKVFVIGDEDVGKSTLISSLQREEWLLSRIISYIKSLIFKDSNINKPVQHNVIIGSGVHINNFNSRSYGHVQLYEFVGDRLFHDSQSDLLKETEFSPRIFLIVIDLSQELEKIKLSIRFWLSFLESTESKPKMHIIFIGSKFDTSRNGIPRKVKDYLERITPKLLKINYCDFIVLDCRDSLSTSMSQLQRCLDISCSTARNPNTLAFNVHCFQVYLLDKFRDSVAITISDIWNRIEKDKQNVSSGEPLYFLPYDSQRNLLKLCNELYRKGQFLYLKDHVNIGDSWIVINKTELISHAFSVFESELDCFTTNTGVLSWSLIADTEEFSRYNLDMFMNFLTHLEYCQEISDNQIYQLLIKTHSALSTNERWYFFPGLVKRSLPDSIWRQDSSFTHHFGWILQCTNHEQFFTSKFLHVMILRVMFTYSDSIDSNTELPVVEQKRSVWKSGIFWANQFGVESLVDMLPDNQSVVFLMRCREANLVKCIEHRSRVISKIRQCAEEFCSRIKRSELLINPTDIMEYSPESIALPENLFDMKSVAMGVVNLKSLEMSFVNSRTNSTALDNLLMFEPFSKLPASILKEIYNHCNPRHICVLSDHFLTRLAEQISKNTLFLKSISCILCDYNILQPNHPFVTKDNLYIKLVKWRDAHKVTYSCLKKCLDQFSIFVGLNILVS